MRHVLERQDVSIRADNEPHSVHPKNDERVFEYARRKQRLVC